MFGSNSDNRAARKNNCFSVVVSCRIFVEKFLCLLTNVGDSIFQILHRLGVQKCGLFECFTSAIPDIGMIDSDITARVGSQR